VYLPEGTGKLASIANPCVRVDTNPRAKGAGTVSQAQIITIGHELLRGEIVDTNAAYLAHELRKLGFTVSSIHTLPDDKTTASNLLERLLPEQGIIMCTGGLGGTRDDITRQMISAVLRRRLVVDEAGEEHLRRWYVSKGRRFDETDRMQAAFPEGGMLLPNEAGLAFGFYVRDGQRHIFALPGVPGEMKSMFTRSVLPQLDKTDLVPKAQSYEVLNFIDISEYTLDRIVDEIIGNYTGIEYGTRSSDGLIRVRLESVEEGLEDCLVAIENRLGENVLCRGERNLEDVVGELLREKGRTLSVAESCSGGLLSKLITDVPGSSDYFMGGVVSYGNEIKKTMLGVEGKTLAKYGAVSENTAREMAVGVMKRFCSDTALGITGIAGPGGGSPNKPVGTVCICLAARDGTVQVETNRYLGDRKTVRMRSANKALSMLFRYLKGEQ